jgi:CRP-like cAMP-binding protein
MPQHDAVEPVEVLRYRPSIWPEAAPQTKTDVCLLRRENQLLAALPLQAFTEWIPHLEVVAMSRGQVLCKSGHTFSHVYFPATSIASLTYQLENGDTSAITMAGNEGAVGISLLMGGHSMPYEATVETSGWGFRLHARTMLNAFQQNQTVMRLMLLYIEALVVQIAQAAVCNRHHALEQRLCLLLLRVLDRTPDGKLALTHERISSLLGVRREGVTDAARGLRSAGVIQYGRGHITVVTRAGLEQRVCECYSVVRQESRRLLPSLEGQ